VPNKRAQPGGSGKNKYVFAVPNFDEFCPLEILAGCGGLDKVVPFLGISHVFHTKTAKT
jgi:hypothetical protein